MPTEEAWGLKEEGVVRVGVAYSKAQIPLQIRVDIDPVLINWKKMAYPLKANNFYMPFLYPLVNCIIIK